MPSISPKAEAGAPSGCQSCVHELLADEFDTARVVHGAIPAMHGGQNAVGRRLQRHVKMLGDARSGSEQRDQILGDIERFDRADAQALNPGLVKNAAKVDANGIY